VLQEFGLFGVEEEREQESILATLPAFDCVAHYTSGLANIEVGFGAPKSTSYFWSLPSVKAYEEAREGMTTRYNAYEVVTPADPLFDESLQKTTIWLKDVLEDIVAYQRQAIILNAVVGMTQIVGYLGGVRNCFIPLITAFEAAKTDESARCILTNQNQDLLYHLELVSSVYSYADMEVALMQFEWVKFAMEKDPAFSLN